MSYSSELTKQRILECAKEEFLIFGFQEANLRRIATKAKTTTGALYHHFGGKDALFDALVKDVAKEFAEFFHELHRNNSLLALPEAESISLNGTQQVLAYIYDHFDIFRLLFLASEGSTYGNFLDKLSQEEEQQLMKFDAEALKAPLSKIDKLFLCYTTRQGYQALYEIVSNNLSYDEAVQFMDKTFRFRMGGWLALHS